MRIRWWPLPALLVYLFLLGLTWTFETGAHAAQRLQPRSFGGGFRNMKKPGRKRARRSSGKDTTYQRIRRTKAGYSLEFGFRNFDRRRLTLKASLDARTVADSIREFGFRKRDFDKLDAWFERVQQQAIDDANKRMVRGRVTGATQAELNRKMRRVEAQNRKIQSELDWTLENYKKEYQRRRLEIYKKAGFKYKKKGVVEVDIPAVVHRNWKRVRPVAQGFARIARERSYDQEDLVGAVTAMVQTSIRYEVPDTREGSRVIAGFMPPLESLVKGEGDCDTKSGVIASVLSNWPNVKLVGLGIPGHYLMAVHRIPRSGDVYIEHQGIPYVMIESAGPAWLQPGTVGDFTMAYLNAGHEFRIQPL